jgi:NhaP-type Na+/H+ or K+/H+ antiporter
VDHGLDTQLIMVIAAVVVGWGLLSARLERFDVSAPLLFVVMGLVLANEPISAVHVNIHSETLRSIAEITLALLLFSDAARVNVRELRRDAAVPARLLFIGLPLTIGLGMLVAVLLFPSLDVWAAATIAACVAPTDAALGAQVVEDRHVPVRIRRVLGVESGLNDGIATPFVTFFVAGAVGDLVTHATTSLASAVGDLAIGTTVGLVGGLGAGWLLGAARRHGWSNPAARGIVGVALALLAYSSAVELGGNGFIAAFVGGLALGTVLPEREQEDALSFDAQTGELLSFVVWFLFGAVLVSALSDTTWQTAVFVVLALTAVRMVPVALSLVGSRLDRTTVAFIGWFGPRGLASVVFGILAFDSLNDHEGGVVTAAVTLTVLASVLAHGVTARPLSRRYGAKVAALGEEVPERATVPHLGGRPRVARIVRRAGRPD